MIPAGLYIDFPFCLARCSFCAFNIQGYREGLAERYIAALRREMLLYAEAPIWQERVLTSVYFGGGTPTLYPPAVLVDLLSLYRQSFPMATDAEVTIEAHPATIDLSILGPLREGAPTRGPATWPRSTPLSRDVRAITRPIKPRWRRSPIDPFASRPTSG